MSLTTLLEAAKYLDYLDSSQSNNNNSNNNNQNLNQSLNPQQDQHQQQQQHHINIYQQNEPSQAAVQGQSANSGGTSYRPIKKSPSTSGRVRARRLTVTSRKQLHVNNDMIAMSLPASATLGHSSGLHHLASGTGGGNSSFMMMTSKSPPPSAGLLSSSYTGAGSPQSSPTSIALLSSKTSGVTSNISSAASSLSSSDTSSSCGEILMSELDFNQCATSVGSNCSLTKSSHDKTTTNHHDYHKQQPMHQQPHISHTNNNNIELLSNIQQQNQNNNNNIYNNYNQLTHPFNDANATTATYYGGGPSSGHSMPQPITGGQNDNSRRVAARRKTSRSSGAKGLMTLASSAGSHHQHHQSLASTSVPLDGSLHAGRVFHATSVLDPSSGQLKFAAQPAHQYHPSNRLSGSGLDLAHGSTYMSVSPSYFCASASSSGITNQSSPPTHQSGSLIMARVQPMIFQHNSLAQQASGAKQQQSIMAFQQATSAAAPSPTSTSSSYSRHRELHKTLEKNRRAHLRHCFELLKAELPSSECVDRKTSHINIIRSAIRCVLSLIEQGATLEQELKRQLDLKSTLTNQLSCLKGTLTSTSSSSNQQPVAEQQLSFLLSRSKID